METAPKHRVRVAKHRPLPVGPDPPDRSAHRAREVTAATPEAKTRPVARAPEVKPPQPAPSAELGRPASSPRNKIILGLAVAGIVAGLVTAYVLGLKNKVEEPVFKPVGNPYASAIHANGIVESDQSSGANVQIYSEVSGPVTRVRVKEGQKVAAGAPLFTIDDSVQRATTEAAESNRRTAEDQYRKRRAAFEANPKSISLDALDTAKDSYGQAAAAWKAANALLRKYTVKAPIAGVVLAINTTPGSYVSSLGSYDAYTQALGPLVIMGSPQDTLAVRCYVDEILVSRLPASGPIRAEMSVRGTDLKVPLTFVRVQPFVSPKIELSNQRQEQVDLRVLPVIFRFKKEGAPIYPGQLVDVFIEQPGAGAVQAAGAGTAAGSNRGR